MIQALLRSMDLRDGLLKGQKQQKWVHGEGLSVGIVSCYHSYLHYLLFHRNVLVLVCEALLLLNFRLWQWIFHIG
jgi:hypothetical protein